MNIKKLSCIILGGLSLCGLCACGNQNSNQTQQSTENSSATQTVEQKSLVSYHTPEAIKKRGELVVGVKSNGFDFFKNKDGADSGYLVDLSNAIAKDIGEEVKVKFVESEYDPMLESLASGDIDLAFSPIKSDSKEKYTLSKSYYPWEYGTSSTFILKSNKEKYNSLNDFSNSKIAAVKNSAQESVIEQYVSDATLISCESINECIEKLKSGEVDVFVADDTDIGDSLKDNEDIINSDITIPESSEDQGAFVLMMKDNSELAEKVNETINTHKENGDIENWLINAYSEIISMGISNYNEDDTSTEVQ